MKKLLSFLLAVCCLFVLASCKEVEYQLDITINEKVYAGDVSNYVVTVNPGSKEIQDYECVSSNTSIFTVVKGKITGVNEGSASLTITCVYDKQELSKSIEVLVNVKEENYELSIEYKDSLVVYEESEISVVEKNTNSIITDFNIFNKNEDIISVENNKITALKEGVASFVVSTTFNDRLLSKECTLTVSKVLTTKIELVVEKTTLKENEETTFKVIIEPTNATNKEYDLILSQDDVLKVDGNKLVALKEGTCVVTAICLDSNIQSSAVITVEKEVNENAITTNIPNSLYVNQLIEVEAFYNGQKLDDFTLTLGNEDIVYYDEESKILEPFDEGKSSITIKAKYNGEVIEDTFEVIISIANFDLVIETNKELIVNDISSYEVYIEPGHIKLSDYVANSTKPEILEIQGETLLAKAYGKVTLIVSTTYQGVNLTKSVEIKVNRYVETSVSINIPNNLFIGRNINPVAILNPYGTTLEITNISASNGCVKYENGVIIPNSIGNCTLTVSYKNGDQLVKEEINVTINEFTDLVVECEESLYENEVSNYKVYALPNNIEITDYTIESSNDNILTNKGLLLGNKVGNGSIKISYEINNQNVKKEVSLSVLEYKLEVKRIYLSIADALLEGNKTTAIVTSYPQVDDLSVVITSSDDDVISVDNDLNISANSLGSAVITAKLAGDESIFTTKTVKVIKKNDEMIFFGTTASGTSYEGKYYEESIKNYYELLEGVTEVSYQAYTSTMTENIDVDGYLGLDGMIEPGKYYSQNVHVLSVPSSKNIQIIPWANLSSNIWTLTTVKGLIQNYEELNPGKKVICAVNGDFFDIKGNGNLPYQTTGENISDGEFYKTSSGFGPGGGTLGFTNDGSSLSLIAKHGAQRTQNMKLAIYDANGNIVKTLEVENLNKLPGENTSSVYFGVYNSDKEYVPINIPEGFKTFVVNNAEKALPNNENDFYGLGTITSDKPCELQKGEFGIVTNNSDVIEALSIGTRIRIQYEFTGEYANIKSATGYNTVIYNDPNQLPDGYLGDRAPRTVIGMKEDGTLIMMVVDGRQGANGMFGCDGSEIAAIMKTYGCIKAYNVDGGGSSTIVVRTESGFKVLNSPSDGRERSDGNCILVVTDDPGYNAKVETTCDSAEITVTNNNFSLADKKVYVDVEGILYETVNGKITISNLVHNTTYNYKVYYEKDGNMYSTLTLGSFTTDKSGFKFFGAVLTEDISSYTFELFYDDYEKASNCSSAQIIVNGTETFLTNGKIVLSKQIFGDYINSLQIKYWYIEGKDKIDKTITLEDIFLK